MATGKYAFTPERTGPFCCFGTIIRTETRKMERTDVKILGLTNRGEN